MKLDIKYLLKHYSIIFAFVLVCVLLAALSPAFLKITNIMNVIRQTSIYGIMAVGMTFIILTGGIDLSVGAILALSGIVLAGSIKSGMPLELVIPLTLLIGTVTGLVNGIVITAGKITPFVATLGMMSVARGLTLIYSKGYPISGFDASFRFIGGGDILGLPLPIIFFFVTVLVAWVILNHTKFGRYTYAIGGNEETVKLSGINSNYYKVLVYMVAGFTCAMSALILTARLNSAEPIAGTGYELDVIAAVVIGGTSLNGGRGNIWGTLVGALLIGVINNGMNLLGISPYFQLIVRGLIIILAVLLDRLRDDQT
jgi:ribose transport system permease protein